MARLSKHVIVRVGADNIINYEDDALYCEHGERIESAYAEPEDE